MPLLKIYRLGRVEYSTALKFQELLVRTKLSGAPLDYLLLLEHEPVYTLGRGANEADLQGAPRRLGVPVFRVSRGGHATFHGPGQLVAYPIVALARHGRDVHRYVRGLEEVGIAVCRDFGVPARRVPGFTGVWVEDRKIASIGVGVRRWVTYHGLALNVAPDLRYFAAIVPCALVGVQVTSLEAERAQATPMEAVADVFARRFCELFGYAEAGEAAVEVG